MKNIIAKLLSGICAGIMISIGGAIYVASTNKVVGAILFTVALSTICFKGFALFTGKVGYLAESHKKDDFETVLVCLLGNLIGTVVCGYLLGYALNLTQVAYVMCSAKLEFSLWKVLIKAIMCGILMYVAVSVYKEHNKNLAGIMLCIPTFILAGFEHSIADMFYFALGNLVSLEGFVFILVVILGNAIGGMLLPILSKLKIK